MLSVHAPGTPAVHWYVGQERPLDRTSARGVVEVRADGQELTWVLTNFDGIRRIDLTRQMVSWYGDDAKFIAANLGQEPT